MAQASVPYFAVQNLINVLLLYGVDEPNVVAEKLKDLPLPTLRLWLRGSDAQRQRAAQAAWAKGKRDEALKKELDLRALAVQ
jgi:hypothetical protein